MERDPGKLSLCFLRMGVDWVEGEGEGIHLGNYRGNRKDRGKESFFIGSTINRIVPGVRDAKPGSVAFGCCSGRMR